MLPSVTRTYRSHIKAGCKLYLVAFCVVTDGMSEPSILKGDQISTGSTVGVGSIRPSAGTPFSTLEPTVTVMINLTNNKYPNSPQLGKVNVLEDVSENIESYEVYYRKVRF